MFNLKKYQMFITNYIPTYLPYFISAAFVFYASISIQFIKEN